MQRCPANIISLIDIALSIQQRSYHRCMAIAGCPLQWRGAMTIRAIRIDASVKQHLDVGQIPNF